MKQSEVLRLMIHDIVISKSTKEPIVTLELFYPDDEGHWVGAGPITLAIGNSVSLFAEAIAQPVPWNEDKGEQGN